MKDYVVSLIADDTIYFFVSADEVIGSEGYRRNRIYFKYCGRLVCAIDPRIFTYEEVD